MKKNWLIVVLVLGLICSQISPSKGQENPSSWAVDEVDQARRLGLIGESAVMDYQAEITREEFIEFIMQLYDQMERPQIDMGIRQSFKDTDNLQVERARALGIIYGTGDNRFNPQGKITRQEMAVILYRTLLSIDPDWIRQHVALDTRLLYTFADVHTIETWAREAMVFTYQQDIITGDNRQRIKPLARATQEEAIAIIYRTFLGFREDISLGMSLEQLKQYLGEPSDILASAYGFSWYIFAQDYGRYLQAGVNEGRVVAFYTESHLYRFAHEIVPTGLTHGILWVDDSISMEAEATNNLEQRQALGHSYETQLYHLANVARYKAGKSVLMWDTQAAKVAYLHSQDMAEHAYVSHTSLDGRRLEDRLKEEGIHSKTAAENIATNQNAIFSHQRLISTWRYRINILGDMKKIGIGSYLMDGEQGQIYHTQIFYD